MNSDGRVGELGHFISDDSNMTLGGGEFLVETTREKGDHEGESSRVYFRNECHSRQEVQSLGNLLSRVDWSLDWGRNKVFNVFVGDKSSGLHEQLVSAER